MIYTKLTKKAMKLCFEKHKDQVDRCGIPYPFHPFHVAESMMDEDTTCVALLHDIVEDSDMALEQLHDEGFPDEVVEAVKLLTHDESVPYFEYVAVLKDNKIAREVKMADLKHNSDISRLDVVTDRDLKRMEKYKKAFEILEQ